ncbi:MAG: ABC transporter substrate-binding protein [Gammaproteobacteria bacterium]
MKQKTFFSVLIRNCQILLLIIVSITCSAAAFSNEQKAFKTSIQLNWLYQFEFAGPIAAKEKGFYKEAGLDVVLRQGGPDVNPVDPVVNQQADFGISGSSLIVERYHGKPVVALNALMQHSAVALLAKKSSGIDSVYDLVGKRLAITTDTAVELEAYLKSQGITGEDYTDLHHYVPVEGLEKGEADAVAVYLSNELFHIQENIDDYIIFSPRSSGIDLFGNILFTHEDMITKHPEIVEAFRMATIRGWEYALKKPEEIAQIIQTKYNSQQKSLEHLLFEAEKLNQLTRTDIVEAGYMSPGRWQHVADVYIQQGKIDENFKLDGFLYDSNPETDLTWFYITLFGSLIIIIIVSLIAFNFRKMNRDLEKAKALTEQASQAKTEFLSRMSHELRTPLNAILGFGQLLETDDRLDTEQKDFVKEINHAGNHLLNLINEVLDLSRIEAGKLQINLETFTVKPVADECIQLVLPLADEQNIQIINQTCDDMTFYGDTVRFKQVLINLLSNAIKYNKPNGEVFVTTFEKNRRYNGISIRDTGEGIPKSKIDELFEPFNRLNAEEKNIDGTGIGLAISKRFAEMMNGKIEVKSKIGNGTTFSLLLPGE